MYTTTQLLDLTHTQARDYLARFVFAWEALKELKQFIYELGKSLPQEYEQIKEGVWVHTSAEIAPTACIQPPCIIGANTQVRHCAFIRGSALIGNDCVVGNSVELKNVILFDNVQTPHYNYVGDSILGYKAHMGAGAITSNVKADKSNVVIKRGKIYQETGMKKVGAFLGDYAEVGCNSVLNPGTVLGRNCQIYPLSSVRGTVEENCIFKSPLEIVKKEEK